MMLSNFVVPGTGTIMNGLCFHQDPDQSAECGNVLMGVGQLLLSVVVVGWVHSVVWGLMIYHLNK